MTELRSGRPRKRDSIPRKCKRFLFVQGVRTVSQTQSPIRLVIEALYVGLKLRGREDDH